MPKTNTDWPRKLKAWRGENSQEWAARTLGVSNSAYIRWEKGATKPKGLYSELVNKAIGKAAV